MPATFLYRFVFPLLAGIFLLVFPASTDALEPGEFDAAPWSKLLERFVTPQGVDYAAWKAHGTKDLDAWLALAAKHDIHSTLAKEPKAAKPAAWFADTITGGAREGPGTAATRRVRAIQTGADLL